MQQIDAMFITLEGIGFKAIKGEETIQLIDFDDSDGEESLLEEISDSIRVIITFDDSQREESDYLFQGCELKVYFDEPKLEDQAKEVKFYIASILNDHGIFNEDPDLIGTKMEELSFSPDEMIVP